MQIGQITKPKMVSSTAGLSIGIFELVSKDKPFNLILCRLSLCLCWQGHLIVYYAFSSIKEPSLAHQLTRYCNSIGQHLFSTLCLHISNWVTFAHIRLNVKDDPFIR